MKRYQRLITILTATALFAASLFGPADWGMLLRASAVNPGNGAGTENNPYIIDSRDAFLNLMIVPNTEDKFYKQTVPLSLPNNFTPVSVGDLYFRGTYDGNGNTITVESSDARRYGRWQDRLGGVFDRVGAEGTIKNLNVVLDVTLEGRTYEDGEDWPSLDDTAFISGPDYYGGLVGELGGKIQNCGVTGRIRMTQHYTERYFREKPQYELARSAESTTFVGGIVGQMNLGVVENCYSDVIIELGSHGDELFLTRYNINVGTEQRNVQANYTLNAGGFVGELRGGTIRNNLAENVDIYIGNATGSPVDSNDYTRAFAGGLVGSVQGSATVAKNLVRGGNLNADVKHNSDVGLGTAGFLAGQVGPSVSVGGFSGNYTKGVSTKAAYRDAAWYKGSGWNVYDRGATGMDTYSSLSASSLDSAAWADVRESAETPSLTWRSLSAPSVPDTFSNGTGETGTNPLIKADSPTKIVIELKPTAVEDPHRAGSSTPDASKIRYKLSVTGGSQYAAPTAKVSADNTKIELTPPPGAAAFWGTGATGTINRTGNIDISAIPSGDLQTYRIQSQGNGNVADSKIRTITVTRTQTMPSGISPAAIVLATEEEKPFTPGKLATPMVALHGDGDKLTLTHENPTLSSVEYVWYKDNVPTDIKPTESLAGLVGTYTVTAVDKSGTGAYQDSDPLEVTITPTGGGSSDWTVVTDNATSNTERATEEDTLIQLATPTITNTGSSLSVEDYEGGAPEGAYEYYWGDDPEELAPGIPDELTDESGLYYAQTVAVNTTEYKDSNVLKVTITPPDNSGDGWNVTCGDAVPGKSFTKGTLATPEGVYSIPDKTITLSYPGPKAEGVTFVYGTTEALGSTGGTISNVEPATYYVQSIDKSGLYEDSNVLTVPLTADTVTVKLDILGDENDFAGKTQGETKEYTYENKIHEVTGSSMVLTATGMDLGLGSKITLEAWMDGERAQSVTESFSAPGGTPTPLITPGADGNLAGGVTIKSEPGATIYYTISDSATEPDAPVPGATGTTEVNSSSVTIPWRPTLESQFTGATLYIKAIAKGPGNAAYSAVTEAVYTVANKPQPDGVSLLINNENFDSSRYYPPGSEVHFDPRPEAGETIRYTTTGETPTAAVGSTYAPDTPYKLPPAMSFVDIKAYLHRNNFPDSPILSERVLILAEHGKPLFSLEQNAEIALGQALTFLPDSNDLPEKIRPKYYLLEGDASGTTYTIEQVRNVPGSYYGVIELDFSEQGSFQYADYAGLIPTLNYTVNGVSNKTYTFGVPEIRFVRDYVEVSGTRTPHTPAEKIPLIGKPGETVTVKAYLDSNNESQFADGEPETRNFLLQEAVATPTASPGSPDAETNVPLGQRLSLRCATTGARIFYSTTGIPEVASENGAYVAKAGTDTYAYDMAKGVVVDGEPEGYFTVYAIACQNGYAVSEPVAFHYRINALDKAGPPTATPATSSDKVTVVRPGASVLLTCSTADANIYYRIGGTPVVTKNADGSYSPSSGTLLYDPSGGITIDGKAGAFVTVAAIAVKTGMNPSDIAVFPYQLPAPVQSVYASPSAGEVVKGTEVELSTTTEGATIYYEVETGGKNADDAEPFVSPKYSKAIVIDEETSITAVAEKDGVISAVTSYEYTVSDQIEPPVPSIPGGSVVPRGTKITLITKTAGTTITYTKDGSDPTKTDNKNRMHGAEVSLDAEEGKSVSLNAYATKTGMTPSETVTLSYTIAKASEVFTASPPSGNIVKPGDLITLTSSVTDAKIHYTTDGSDPTIYSNTGNSITVAGGYGETFVIRAVAAFHEALSVPQVFTYTIVGQAAAPSASIPNGAVIMVGAKVSLSAPEGTVHYTLDGSEPNTSSPMYTEPIALTGSVVLKAVAVAEGKAMSPVAEYVYTMAGQVAAPTASSPSGPLVAGTQISLTSTTEGASIYYSTDGTDPSEDNLGNLFPYEAPIAISRPVTIKMFAVKTGLHTSAINTVTYTVQDPPPPPEETAEEESDFQMDSDKLFLFDQFLGADSGPLFSDIVLRDPVTQVVLSASAGIVPEGVQLVTNQNPAPTSEHNENAMRALDLRLESVYDISLVLDSEEVQPSQPKSVEIGLPIPEGYEDTVVIVCHISENGTVSGFPTRRSGGIAYAVVDHFSKFAVAVPPYDAPLAAGIPWQTILFSVLGLAAAGIPTGLFLWKRKQNAKNTTQTEKRS